MGFTVFYLCLIVLVPLLTLPAQAASLGWQRFWATISDPRVVASYRLTLGASLAAACVNGVFGLLVAWVLVRYEFPGRRIVDALIDLPFALPTAVAGITLTALYAPNGWLGGRWRAAASRSRSRRSASRSRWSSSACRSSSARCSRSSRTWTSRWRRPRRASGRSRGQVIRRVILPYLYPAWLTGFALAFARAIGEYGSVVFISGNMPMRTEITPLLIMTKLEQYDYAGATAIALVLLLISFVLLFAINALQGWSARRLAN